MAKWIATCITDYSDFDNPLGPTVLVLGDSGTDLELARNLANKTSPPLDVSCSIMNRGIARPKATPTLDCRVTSDWGAWARETRKLIEQLDSRTDRIDHRKFIICDIDKSLIMPERHGESTQALHDLRVVAYSKMLTRFFVRNVTAEEAGRLYELSEKFPPYVTSATKGDEDVRAVGAVLLGLGLLDSEQWGESPDEPLISDILQEALEAAIKSGLSSSIVAVIAQLHERTKAAVPTVLEEFRECEHEAFLELQEQGRFFMNGRILECLKIGCETGWVPIGYSDRPGASVGLRIDAHHSTAWPVLPKSLISLPANIVYPD